MDEMKSIPSKLSGNRKGTTNTTLAVLVMVALLVTIITTWTVLTASSANVVNTNVAKQTVVNKDSGKVTLTVLTPAHKTASSVGMVTLEIKKA